MATRIQDPGLHKHTRKSICMNWSHPICTGEVGQMPRRKPKLRKRTRTVYMHELVTSSWHKKVGQMPTRRPGLHKNTRTIHMHELVTSSWRRGSWPNAQEAARIARGAQDCPRCPAGISFWKEKFPAENWKVTEKAMERPGSDRKKEG